MNKIKCKKCGWIWKTKSVHYRISCPSCGDKNINKDMGLNDNEVDMNKKTKVKFVYQKKILKEKNICGMEKGETGKIMNDLSRIHNIPMDEINVEFD